MASSTETFCSRCKEDILDEEAADGFYYCLLRKPEDIRVSARSGCRPCGMFEANLSLFDGFEDLVKGFEQWQVPRSAYRAMGFEPSGDNVSEADLERLKKDRVLIMLVVRDMVRLIGTMLCPYTPMVFIIRLPGEIEHLIPHDNARLGPSTDSELTFHQAQDWIKTCTETHGVCRELVRERSQQKFRPKRLLELRADCDTVYLREDGHFDPERAHAPYTTVSHCWGNVPLQRLTTNNIDQFKTTGISKASLSKTHQDAVHTSLKLGVNFVWIDSLCIIQDNDSDWLEQSTQMHQIYSNSYCNIAATSAINGTAGCFRSRDVSSFRPIKITFTYPEKADKPMTTQDIYLTDAGIWWDRFERQPLHRRAWVLQERLLAPRVLHYDSDQIAWECSELVANERFPLGVGLLIENNRWMPRFAINPDVHTKLEDQNPGHALSLIWRPIVRHYTTLSITKWTDRLIALAGVGTAIQNSLGWEYVAGMFMKNLPTQLMWRVIRPGDLTELHDPVQLNRQATRPSHRLAPSWSWLSLDAPVDFMPQWKQIATSASDTYTKSFVRYFEPDEQARADIQDGGARLTPEEMNLEYLCDVTGLRRDQEISAEEAAGMFSTAILQISCYLVPIALPEWQGRTETLQKQWGEGALRGYPPSASFKCVAYPDSPQQQLPKDISAGVDHQHHHQHPTAEATSQDEPTLKNPRQEDHDFEATLAWDIADECSLEATDPQLFLMPVLVTTQLAEDHFHDTARSRHIYGLMLAREMNEENKTTKISNRFRRLGHFTLKLRDSRSFWQAAERREPIDGVRVVTRDNVACSVVKPQSADEANTRGDTIDEHFERRDGVEQYQVELI